MTPRLAAPRARAGALVRRRPRAFQRIVEEVRQDVFRRRVAPGDRLPNEAGLAERFGVSRLAVREALRVLELQGLVEVSHGFRGGSFIAEGGTTHVSQALETMLRLEHLERDEIYTARRYLEPNIAALSSRRLDEATRTRLEANIAESVRRIASGRPAFAANLEFHSIIAGACGNRILTLVADAVLELLRAAESRRPSSPEVNREASRAHAAIFRALVAGDRDRAHATMALHLERLERHYTAGGGRS